MNQTEPAAIANGAAIIERFGGIRPMANKINVPVTTVQGWKKRNAIPSNRLDQIQQAAREHSVDISDILNASIANENEKAAFKEEVRKAESRKPEEFSEKFDPPPLRTTTQNPMPNVVYQDLAKQLSQAERQAVTKSTLINLFFLLIIGAAIGILLWPDSPISKDGRHMAALEEKVAQLRVDVAGVKRDQNTMESSAVVVPAEIQQQISQLQQQVQTVTATAATAAATAAASATEAFGPDITGALEQRIAKLEEHVGAIVETPALSEIVTRFQSLMATPEGEHQLANAWNELSSYIASTPQDLSGLQNTVTQSPALATAFQGVTPANVKAAAMLFAMTQVRAIIGRENVAVERDLQVLKTLAGPEDAELTTAIDRLAPLAGSRGLMSVAGLTSQFQAISGDVIAASLSGQDVSISDVAKARLGQVMQVEKDGQLVSGTPVQATVVDARTKLESGDLPGAIAAMQTLNGPAASAAQPWLANANTTIAAQQLVEVLTRAINAQAAANYYKPAQIVQ
jgi:hypothetical protein